MCAVGKYVRRVHAHLGFTGCFRNQNNSARFVLILVSGFEAFGGETLNPTHKLVDWLIEQGAGSPATAPTSGRFANVHAILLPVGFANAFETLRREIERVKPDTVLALGQAGGRTHVELERVAINVMDANIPDNDGFQPRDQQIDSDGREAYFSTLPLRSLEEALLSADIPAQISNTAGLYVCNFLFYKLQSLGLQRSGFVHFPYLPEQTAAKQKPSLDFETMKRALETMLAALN